MPPGPEYKYIMPALQNPSEDTNKRYRARSRRHGCSLELFDDYLKRGIDVDIDLNASIREVAEKIVHFLSMDFTTGRFSSVTVWPVVRDRLMAMLLNPINGLTIEGQATTPWEVRRTLDPEIFAVIDHRRIPDRKGDIHPIYLMRLFWLAGNFNFVHHIHRCSTSYDRIRASLYRAVPNPADRSHRNRRIQPWNRNRFVISMNSPEKWWIQDSYLGRDYPLRDYLVWDMSFDISFWYQLKSSVRDYSCEDYYSSLAHVTGGNKDFDLGEPEPSDFTQDDDIANGDGDTAVDIPSYINPPAVLSSLMN